MSGCVAGGLRNTYGVDGTPFFRPPYGWHNPDTDRVAADLGYHTITLWSGTIGDSRPITATDLVAAAARSFQPQQIVLAHANLPTITGCYGQLLDLIHQRNLNTVTLNDVFGGGPLADRDSRRAPPPGGATLLYAEIVPVVQLGADGRAAWRYEEPPPNSDAGRCLNLSRRGNV